jgi:8-oxo-dGTP pyrophosphatase MutT (NUDIX family)
MRQIKAFGVLVFRSKAVDSFLLMKHPDRFDLPKGQLDADETETECALRELEEETGITAADIELDPQFRFTTQYVVSPKHGGEPRHKTLVVFLGRLRREVPITTTEHQGYQWITWNPPHQIQPQTIDPLLAHVADFFRTRPSDSPDSRSHQ